MTDAIAQAAGTLDAAHSSTEPQAPEVAQVGESAGVADLATNLTANPSPSVVVEDSASISEAARSTSQPAEAMTSKSSEQPATTATEAPAIESGNVAASSLTSGIATTADASSSETGSVSALLPAEHPHTSILRRMTETLRRKFNMFDGELEAIVKDAESHL